MKKAVRPIASSIQFLVCVIVLGSNSGCGSEKPTELANAGTSPEVVSRSIELAPFFVDEQPSLIYEVPVKNETDRFVRFTHLEQSCGCSAGTTLARMELAPGEQTTLRFEIDLRNRYGPQRFHCYLMEAGGGVWTYTLRTNLYAPAQFAEGGAVHFGMVEPRTEESREITFFLNTKSGDTLPSTPVFRSAAPEVRVEPTRKQMVRRADGSVGYKVTLAISLQAPERPGVGQAVVLAEYEKQGKKLESQATVTWKVRTLLSVTPAEVYFGNIDTSSSGVVERRVIVRRSDGQALIIKNVQVPRPAVSCTIEPSPSDTVCCLRFCLNPKALGDALWGEALVETNYDSQPQLRIPVAALSQAPK